MQIDIRKGGLFGDGKWREVTIREDGTTIKFDVSEGDELKSFHERLIDSAFRDMSMDEIVTFLTENGYADEIIERYENEKSEAA